jgi:transposase
MEKERKRRKFSDEYKAETVRLIQRSGKSIGQMALELGIGETALRRWVEQAEIEAGRVDSPASNRPHRKDPPSLNLLLLIEAPFRRFKRNTRRFEA